MPTPPVNLLWTGGWDSSFRLFDLTVRLGADVQPYYLVDHVRPSTGTEVDTMIALRRALAASHPGAAARVLPVRYREKRGLPADEVAARRMEALRDRTHIGPQYRSLAVWAAADGVDALELSVHRDDRAFLFLDGHVRPDDDAPGGAYVLVDDPGDDAVELFRPFRFPLLDWTKTAMDAHAVAHGFQHLLHQTWFCHEPLRGAPCGQCNPCRYAVDEGMAWRIPRRRRLLARARDVRKRAGLGTRLRGLLRGA